MPGEMCHLADEALLPSTVTSAWVEVDASEWNCILLMHSIARPRKEGRHAIGDVFFGGGSWWGWVVNDSGLGWEGCECSGTPCCQIITTLFTL